MKISTFVIAFLAAIVPRLAAEPLASGDVAAEDIAFIADIDGSEQKYVQVLPPSSMPRGPLKFSSPCMVMVVIAGSSSVRIETNAEPFGTSLGNVE